MTCNRFKNLVGYKGQTHEVLADKEDGSTTRLGWQNGDDLSGWESLVKVWRMTNLRARCAGCNSGCPECEPYITGKVGPVCETYLSEWDVQCAGRASFGPCQCGLFKGHKRPCVCGTCGHERHTEAPR